MSLFSALSSTSSALAAFEQALTVTQNNVNNASTPGYARQTQVLEALPFQAGTGETGGVRTGAVEDSRNTYAEQAVQQSTSQLGTFQQQVQTLTSLQGQFDISGNTGIPSALNKLFSAFSSWSVNPNTASTQQNVLSQAQSAAATFQQTAAGVTQIASSADGEISSLVDQVNRLAAQLSSYNAQIQNGDRNDSALQARLYSTLERLSEVANVTTISQPDGTMSVLLGGQTALVSGAHANRISVAVYVPQPPPPVINPSGPPSSHILAVTGSDITAQVTGGKLGGALTVRNQVIPAIQGDAYQTGALNQLAKAFADRVNTLLTSGTTATGQPGAALFSYDASKATNTAASLVLNPALTTSQLAAADASGSNGTALALSGLAQSANPADQVNGQTYTQFFGSVAAQVGAQLSTAQNGQSVQKDLVTQAQSLRQQASGVDLNAEATQMMQYQQAYQAASKMITVIDTLTQTVLNMIGPSSVA